MNSESDAFDDELDEIEALMARRLSRGKGKYKGKLLIIFFSCNNVRHIVARCLEKEDKDKKR